jgi:hypothetical protein
MGVREEDRGWRGNRILALGQKVHEGQQTCRAELAEAGAEVFKSDRIIQESADGTVTVASVLLEFVTEIYQRPRV